MSGQVQYLVQVNCQPSPVGHEDRIIEILSRSFNVQRCHSTRAGVNLSLESDHPLAYGAFKDLADAVEQALDQFGSRLLSGVINRVNQSPVSVAIDALEQALLGGIFGVKSRILGSLADSLMARMFGIKGLKPMLYFYKGDFVYMHEVGGLQWAASIH